MKHIEIGTPSVLPLAFAKMDVGGVEKPVMLGFTMQHPPIHFLAGPSKALNITGPRAHVARRLAHAYAESTGESISAEIQIEHTSPAHCGLFADPLTALTNARTFAWLNGNDPDDTAALAQKAGLNEDAVLPYWAFARGGVLLVEMTSQDDAMPRLLRRFALKHRDHEAWALTYHFPPHPQDAPASLEQDRYAQVKEAAEAMPIESGRILSDTLWPALENNDFETFCQALIQLRDMNLQGLAAVDGWQSPTEHAQNVMRVMGATGAAVVGESFTGITVFSLSLGAAVSQQIRAALMREIGYFKGQFEHTICDIDGSKLSEKDVSLHRYDYKVPMPRKEVSGPGKRVDR